MSAPPAGRRRRRHRRGLWALGLVGLLAAVGAVVPAVWPVPDPAGATLTTTPAAPVLPPDADAAGGTTAVVSRVIDGDTLVLSDGRHVRLLGIDAPEKGQCWHDQATVALITITPPGALVTITPDPTQASVDRYGRTLAYVTATTTAVDASEALLRQGAARIYVYGATGPVTRTPQYTAAQQAAQRDGLGVWACPAGS